MKAKHLRLAPAAGALTLSLAALTSCSAPLPNGAGECTFTVDYPHGSDRKAGYIDGKGKGKCTFSKGKLTDLKIETRLQKWNGSTWVTASGSTNATTQKTVKSDVTYTGVSGFIVCQKGTFRTQARGSGYLDGVYSGSSDW